MERAMTTDIEISKALSFWLRHRPGAGGIDLTAEGWADVDAVLAALTRSDMPIDWERLTHVVDSNDKSRFEISSDGRKIRARQGHSIEVKGSWQAAAPPAILYHGTVERFWPAISAEGLRPMKRQHVHLSPDEETARRVGQRRGAPLILHVDAAGLAAAGEQFFQASNNVWLVAAVPPAFLAIGGT